MSPKTIALLIVGMVLVSGVFFIFHVSYPSNPATIKFNHVPKNVKPPNYQIFQNQTYNQPGLGLNQTSFTPSGNTSMILQGFVYNASSPGGLQPIANKLLGVAVMQALTLVRTNSQGFYQVKILASGQGTFAFKVFQFRTNYTTLYIGQGISVHNRSISLTPQPKYSISGFTQSLGKNLSGVALTFGNFWGKYYSSSGLSGAYSLDMVDGNYTITAVKNGFEPVPRPQSVNVSNSSIPNYDLTLFSTSQAAFYMNGYIFNQLGNSIPNALIYDSTVQTANGANISQPNGFYNISVAYYLNAINILNATGYTVFAKNVPVFSNLTNENFTLEALDPFRAPSGQTGITTGEPSGLGNDISQVNYATGLPVSISGQVISRQTGMPVPNQAFTLYTSVNGTYFNDIIKTNGSGFYNVNLLFTGNYHINVTSAQYYDTWLNGSLTGSVANHVIYVSTSPNKVYHLSGGVLNGLTNSTLANATINIYSNTGGYLTTVHTNATGQFNISLLGGTYKISVSNPGFNITNVTTTITGNQTGLNVPITPTSSIASGSSVWNSSSGTGLPGVNGSSVSSQLNNTQNLTGISPATNSSVPVSLDIRMLDNATKSSINNTSYEMYIKVNGLTLNLTGRTNSTGYAYLNLSYGGSYILLPEMIDYSGIATLVNTSQYQAPGKVLDLYLNPLPVYKLSVNLTDQINESIPTGSLSVTGFSLPVMPNNSITGRGYSNLTYLVPSGTYLFTYSNVNYVVKNFSINVKGSNLNSVVPLQPYALALYWNTTVAWSYELTGAGSPGNASMNSGAGLEYIPLQYGAYVFIASFNGNSLGPKTFNLTRGAPNSTLIFETQLKTEILKNVTANVSMPAPFVLKVNAVLNSNETTQNEYISQIGINVNIPSNATLSIGTGVLISSPVSNVFYVSKNFVLVPNGQTTLSITADTSLSALSQDGGDVNLNITYYTASLTG